MNKDVENNYCLSTGVKYYYAVHYKRYDYTLVVTVDPDNDASIYQLDRAGKPGIDDAERAEVLNFINTQI